MKVLHDGSSRIQFPSRSVHQHSFQRSSCILYLAIHSGIVSPLSFEVVIYHSSRMRYLNPSISSLDLSCVMFHLNLSLRIVAIMVLINDPSSSFILPANKLSCLLVHINPILLPMSGRLSPHNLRCIP